jgi:hypothetical protein
LIRFRIFCHMLLQTINETTAVTFERFIKGSLFVMASGLIDC